MLTDKLYVNFIKLWSKKITEEAKKQTIEQISKMLRDYSKQDVERIFEIIKIVSAERILNMDKMENRKKIADRLIVISMGVGFTYADEYRRFRCLIKGLYKSLLDIKKHEFTFKYGYENVDTDFFRCIRELMTEFPEISTNDLLYVGDNTMTLRW